MEMWYHLSAEEKLQYQKKAAKGRRKLIGEVRFFFSFFVFSFFKISAFEKKLNKIYFAFMILVFDFFQKLNTSASLNEKILDDLSIYIDKKKLIDPDYPWDALQKAMYWKGY